MSVPRHQLAPITVDDIPLVSSFLQDSKLQLAINRFVIKDWPNPSFQNAHYTKAIQGGLTNPQTTCLKVVNEVSQQAVAYLFYTRENTKKQSHSENPGGSDVGDEKRNKKEVPDGIVPDVYWAVTDAFEELQSDFGTEDFIGVTHIYVEPSSRQQGIGTWLLNVAREHAIEQKLPFRIIAEPNHHKFFENRGFEDVRSVDIDLTRWAPPLSGYGTFRISSMLMAE
ncbi:hypothetical protein F4808DRAFT_454805 [Astrocystis sublimbata]|nr:hypothetical protein F4808DRAFT_454805 [Astrocystis sublimbata]